jgi:hypothetical protein
LVEQFLRREADLMRLDAEQVKGEPGKLLHTGKRDGLIILSRCAETTDQSNFVSHGGHVFQLMFAQEYVA